LCAITGSLDLARSFIDIAGLSSTLARDFAMSSAGATRPNRRIHWERVLTVLSAAILIGAEVFGAAFAGGWAIANLLGLGDIGVYVLQSVFFLLGMVVMVGFIRNAMQVEPFVERT
jgi:hypothetical protein